MGDCCKNCLNVRYSSGEYYCNLDKQTVEEDGWCKAHKSENE